MLFPYGKRWHSWRSKNSGLNRLYRYCNHHPHIINSGRMQNVPAAKAIAGQFGIVVNNLGPQPRIDPISKVLIWEAVPMRNEKKQSPCMQSQR